MVSAVVLIVLVVRRVVVVLVVVVVAGAQPQVLVHLRRLGGCLPEAVSYTQNARATIPH